MRPANSCFRSVATAVVLLFAIGTLGFSQTNNSAAGAKFTVEQILSSPFPSELVAAKQGARVAWIFNSKGERNIWVADGPDFVARQVTNYRGDEGQQLAGLAFTPDGKTIVYARGSEARGESGAPANPGSLAKEVKQQVWAVDVDAKADAVNEPRLLGDMGCPSEGCEEIAISPDGNSAVWAAKHVLWMAPVAGGGKPAK